MSFFYEFPAKAEFGKVLPKNKIYEHASPSTSVKSLFVKEVDKIIWSYKLSPETINLPTKGDVEEIQIFSILLKTGELKEEVLAAIDKAIPSPILYILSYEDKFQYAAAYKRRSEVDKAKWVVSGYYKTRWISGDKKRIPLPVVLDLKALYHALLKALIPLSQGQNETMAGLINRAEKLKTKERELSRVEARLRKEKQFNRKVEINSKLKSLKKEIEHLRQ